MPATLDAVRPGDPESAYGADGLFYPYQVKRKVPISLGQHKLIAYVRAALEEVFADRDDVTVGADQLLYYIPGNNKKGVAPDGYVIKGIRIRRPKSIRLWEIGANPCFVFEVTSRGSRAKDRTANPEIYGHVLRVPEYLIYDEEWDKLELRRLTADGEYVLAEPGADGRYFSRELGVWFGLDPVVEVRVYDPTGNPVLSGPEQAAKADAELTRADRESVRAEAAEAELAAALAEIQRLKAQLGSQ